MGISNSMRILYTEVGAHLPSSDRRHRSEFFVWLLTPDSEHPHFRWRERWNPKDVIRSVRPNQIDCPSWEYPSALPNSDTYDADKWAQAHLWRVTPLNIPFRLFNPLFTISHTQLVRCVTFTKLTILHTNTSPRTAHVGLPPRNAL
jgi:hypothetical protein